MIALLDTSSLRVFVTYYQPFDKSHKLRNLIEGKIVTGKILILDKVAEESKYQAKGIIMKGLPCLADKQNHTDTSGSLPDKEIFRMLNDEFCNTDIRDKQNITPLEFETRKNAFLKSADCKLILHARLLKGQEVMIVTEETATANDGKLFKKIPELCKHTDIACCTLPELLQKHYTLDFSKFWR